MTMNQRQRFGTVALGLVLVASAAAAVERSDRPGRKRVAAKRPRPEGVAPTQHLADMGRLLAGRKGTPAARVVGVDRNHVTPPRRTLSREEMAARRQQPSTWRTRWSAAGTPRFVRAALPSGKSSSTGLPPGIGPVQAALARLTEHREFFRMDDPKTGLVPLSTVEDADGRMHVRFQRQLQEIPVYAEEMVVHLNRSGQLYAFNGHYRYLPPPPHPPAATLLGVDAVEIVRDHLATRTPMRSLSKSARALLDYEGPTSKLCYWPHPESGERHLAWQVETRPNFRDHYIHFIDAKTGDILDGFNATATEGPVKATTMDLQGEEVELNTYAISGTFIMLDGSRPTFASEQPNIVNNPLGGLLTLDAREEDLSAESQMFHVVSADNSWPDPIAVSAHANMGKIFEYYLNIHGRRGIDGEGSTMISIVHVTDEGEPMDNAFWNGVVMAYGDGDYAFSPLAGALDVAAHETTHGVIARTVNLEYRRQSGALNESFADVFGAMIDRDDWLLGEDVAQEAVFPSGALRDLSSPNNGVNRDDRGWQPDHMRDYVSLPDSIDNGGVHVNSGIPNKACFLLAEAIGRDKTEQIYYRILDSHYLNSRSNFDDMRMAAAQSATDLFGEGSPEELAVAAAFDSVGITGESGYQPPKRVQPTEGEEWLVFVKAEGGDNSLFRVPSDLTNDDDIVQLTSTQVFAESGNAVTVSDDGTFVLFVDEDNYIRYINSDGTDEQVITQYGQWSSIAISPDGSKLAATTVYVDTTIFIIDLEVPENSKPIELYAPTTQQGITNDIVLYADAMDWDWWSESLIYDAFNTIPQATGDPLSFWNVNLVTVDTEDIIPLFPSQQEGTHLGNPAFSRTTSQYAVFDFHDDNTQSNEIWVYDLFSGDAGLIHRTGRAFSFPTFAPDDEEIAYEYIGEDGFLNVARVPLTQDRLMASAAPQDFLFSAQTAKWLMLPDQDVPTSVEEEGDERPLPESVVLEQNYPNPFNSSTTIHYQVPVATAVRIEVFDVLGRRVRELVNDAEHAAGAHTVMWDGWDDVGRSVASGVYVCRMEVTRGTRKQVQSRRMALVQ
ncbi:MAG: M4 family metallopeptidase [Candidatus Latescibacterota bacterium]|nr:M4 family metallopeptidase [Candidatus Latescibacterota bacterium]